MKPKKPEPPRLEEREGFANRKSRIQPLLKNPMDVVARNVFCDSFF
jgi:hypothetical protein